ncbi:MAG TPA: hypothetical protein VLB75_05875, partial [Steroidobacteraceae bacterium]|nr:hypothetical protein [Steroidobacteraceae bacterium]
MMVVIGIDVGGSSIKGAPVDVSSGALTAPLGAVPTPAPATPTAVANAIAILIADGPANEPVGIAVPSVVKEGVT